MQPSSRRLFVGGVGCVAGLAAWAATAGVAFWLIVYVVPGQRLRLPVIVWGVLYAIYGLPGYWSLLAAAAVSAVVGLIAALAVYGFVDRLAGSPPASSPPTAPPQQPPSTVLGPTGTLPSVAAPRPGVAPAWSRGGAAWRHPLALVAGGALLLGMGACVLVGGFALVGLRSSARATQEWEGVAVCRLVDPQSRDVIQRGGMVSYTSGSTTSEVIACFRDAWTKQGLVFLRAEPSYAGGRWMEMSQWRTWEGDYYAYTVYTQDGRTHVFLTKDDRAAQAAPPLPPTATPARPGPVSNAAPTATPTPQPTVTPWPTATATSTLTPTATLVPSTATPIPPAPTRPPVAAPPVAAPQGGFGGTTLEATAHRAILSLPGTSSGVFARLTEPVEYAADDPEMILPAGSLIKLPIAGAAYEQVAAGRWRLGDTFTLTAANRTEGTGVMKGQPLGTTYTLEQVVEIMLLHSDNTAANMLIDRLGGFGPVNDFAARQGLARTSLRRKLFDQAAQARGVENTTTTGDMALLLLRIGAGQVVSEAVSERLLGHLIRRAQRDHEWMLRDLPRDVTAAHLTATLTGYRGDAVIVEAGGNLYILVLFARDPDEAAIERALARVSAEIYQAVVRR